jgi:hypothetical protein
MDRTALRMKKTMEEMLANCGYVATVTIGKDFYTAKLAVSMSGEMTLKYPVTLTPGEVVWQIKSIFDTLNHKNVKTEGKI